MSSNNRRASGLHAGRWASWSPQLIAPMEEGAVGNGELAQLVKEISEIGPRVPEIARRLRRHKETVRYWYRKLEEHDFAIQGMVNHEAFGLRRVILKVKIEKENEASMDALVKEMNARFYVVGYAKTLPDELFIINASVPEEFVAEVPRLRRGSEAAGALQAARVLRLRLG